MYLRGLKAIDPASIISGIMAIAGRGFASSGLTPQLETPGVNVSSTVQTTVSPSISPVFIQQDKPQDSPVNAATQQIAPSTQTSANGIPGANGAYAPTVPMTGAIPGVDYAGGYAPTGTPLFPAAQAAKPISGGVVLAALGIVGAAVLLKKKKTRRK